MQYEHVDSDSSPAARDFGEMLEKIIDALEDFQSRNGMKELKDVGLNGIVFVQMLKSLFETVSPEPNLVLLEQLDKIADYLAFFHMREANEQLIELSFVNMISKIMSHQAAQFGKMQADGESDGSLGMKALAAAITYGLGLHSGVFGEQATREFVKEHMDRMRIASRGMNKN